MAAYCFYCTHRAITIAIVTRVTIASPLLGRFKVTVAAVSVLILVQTHFLHIFHLLPFFNYFTALLYSSLLFSLRMSSPFYPPMFGAGSDHKFNFDGDALLAKAAKPSTEEVLQKKLAEEAATNRALRWELEQAGVNVDNARAAETKARDVFKALRSDYKALAACLVNEQKQKAKMAAQRDEAAADYDHIQQLQEENDRLAETIADLRRKLDRSLNATRDVEKSRDDVDKDLQASKSELETLRGTIDRLKSDLEHEKAAAVDREAFLSKAYADRTEAENQLGFAARARDTLELEVKEVKLQFEDVHNQWLIAQQTIDDLQDQVHAIEDIDTTNQLLQGDIERLQDLITDHERTLLVKDERISHLEAQFQRERQRNLAEADAAAQKAATPGSPIDEPPNPIASVADSLADELDAASDDFEEMEYDEREVSQITEIMNIPPIEKAKPEVPQLSISIAEATKTTPVVAKAPHLSMHMGASTSTHPVHPEPPQLSINMIEAAATTPVVARVPHLTMRTQDIFSIAPMAPEAPQLSTRVHSAAQTTPVVSRLPPLSLGAHTATLTTPKAPAAPRLTMAIQKAASTHPVAATTPQPPTIQPKSSLPFPSSLLHLLLPLLLFFIFALYTDLSAWRDANAIGRTYAYIPSEARGGAYGNGRYLFGQVPLAMDVGHSRFAEMLCKWAGIAIMRVEEWVGGSEVVW